MHLDEKDVKRDKEMVEGLLDDKSFGKDMIMDKKDVSKIVFSVRFE